MSHLLHWQMALILVQNEKLVSKAHRQNQKLVSKSGWLLPMIMILGFDSDHGVYLMLGFGFVLKSTWWTTVQNF